MLVFQHKSLFKPFGFSLKIIFTMMRVIKIYHYNSLCYYSFYN